jgi:hypothetical protein
VHEADEVRVDPLLGLDLLALALLRRLLVGLW